ncbi:uncharacterized protein LOC141880825 [Acropora palmata]|uniref:uncharacterized protein LOC141880825 n=1 Tax=Acropora palmata TaxID=6131 RepID=UPI003DA0B82A
MADKSSWEQLVHVSEKLFPSMVPQVIPGKYHIKKVVQAIQTELKKHTKLETSTLVHCNWCNKAITSNSDQAKDSGNRRLTWDLDWSKKVLKITGVQVCCDECDLLLDLRRLMNFLVSHDSMDVAKFDSLASHFCQINGHSSQSGEDAIKLLQKATSISHSLHVLTKNFPDFTIQGPNGETITLESVNELLKKLLPQADCDSQHKSTVKAKRKKNKEGTLKRDVKGSQISDSLSETNLTSENKRKKKKTFEDFSPTNGHHSEVLEENEEIEDPVKKRLVFSEKKKKVSDGKVCKRTKKMRTLPAR